MKEMLINYDLCTGCKACELVCSIQHYGVMNPKKARIKVIRDEEKGHFYPLVAGPFTDAKCSYKNPLILGGKQYDRCMLCRASCPSRSFFKEPDTGIALKCDMCGDPPDPTCVKFCGPGALTLIDVDDETDDRFQQEEFEATY